MSGTEMRELIREVRTLKKLMAIVAVKDVKVQKERIRLLNAAGLTPSEIAEALGTTANTVSVALSTMRKAGKTRATKEGVEPGAGDDQSQA